MKEIFGNVVDAQSVVISQAEYAALIEDSSVLNSLLALIANKVKSYGGISHNELEMLCTMYGIEKENNA